MIKYFTLIIVTGLFFNFKVNAQKKDTLVYYYKSNINGATSILPSLDSCEYFRMILPPDAGEKLYNVHDFYKDGTVKMVAKADTMSLFNGMVRFEGKCVSFYPNGKRKSIVEYKNNEKVGYTYNYYPDGKLYCVVRNDRWHVDKNLYLECHDKNGNAICVNGNGKWIYYTDDFTKTLLEGPVIKSYREGEWHGKANQLDSISYIYVYKNGIVQGGTGFDKYGKAYPFIQDNVKPSYRSRGNPIMFLEVFRSHLTIPKGYDGKKLSVDSALLSFVIERDGRLSTFEVVGNVDPQLTRALTEAFNKCDGWNPRLYYGVPVRSKMLLPVNNFATFYDSSDVYYKHLVFAEKVLGY